MSYHIKTWATGTVINLLETDTNPITENHMPDQRSEIIISAEIDGDYLEAGELMPLLTVANSELSGVEILAQSYELNASVPYTEAGMLAQKRATASLSRKDFFQALIVAGLYEQVKAIETDQLVPLETRVDLIEATSFDRMYPSLVSMASSMGITDAQLDSIFGII